jgi:eukaryotic-like serine/threonine-protein kinase
MKAELLLQPSAFRLPPSAFILPNSLIPFVMTPERWQQVKELFNAACKREGAERTAFLAAVCADDEDLRREVETLLLAHEETGQFMQRPLAAADQPEVAPTAELLVGQTVGPYRIERRVGAGGMGVVYLARDTRLGRAVALKLLQARFTQDSARVRRFQQEARAASALNHPGLLTIHEIGQVDDAHFIVAEFVDGQTLRAQSNAGGMQLGAALGLLIQVADALAAAHEAGIVHRDIKPENIMLRHDGIAKVLDFGLAKLTEQAAPVADFARITTQPGLVMGTISYMSPEQARGLEVDARSDIFSLGVVIYELLTGHLPFAGETTSDVLVALLHGEPRPLERYVPGLPPALQEIVNRALAKSVAQRYQSARALARDLRQLKEELEFAAKLKGHSASQDPLLTMTVGAATASDAETTFSTQVPVAPTTRRFPMAVSFLRWRGKTMVLAAALVLIVAGAIWGRQWFASRGGAINSIAVLPFANVGNDSQMEYLPDGITESLIASLSQLPGLSVKARATVFTYKGREVAPRQVGQELKVRAVVLGRVMRQGERLVVYTELVDTSDDSQLWGDTYQRSLSDLVTVEREITREISAALRRRLSGATQEQIARRQTANSEAYQLYLRGRYLYKTGRRAEQEKALEYFNQAITLDPNYALAYTGIADVYSTFSAQYLPPSEAIPKARQAVLKALELDETLPEVHLALALIKLFGDWDWAGTERALKRALELNPNLAEAHGFYAGLLSVQGRFAEALHAAQRAEELDPFALGPSSEMGSVLYRSRQYDRALAHYRKMLELDPNNAGIHFYFGLIFSDQGRHQEAISELRQAVALSPHLTYRAWLACVYARAGQQGEALKILRELEARATREHVSPVYLARIYTSLGDKDRAFAWLRKAYAERNDHLLALGVEPVYDPLRGDPRFTELLRDIGLAQ